MFLRTVVSCKITHTILYNNIELIFCCQKKFFSLPPPLNFDELSEEQDLIQGLRK